MNYLALLSDGHLTLIEDVTQITNDSMCDITAGKFSIYDIPPDHVLKVWLRSIPKEFNSSSWVRSNMVVELAVVP